jgi:DNA (cytosine-5)-methyltransferase 1
MKKQKSKKLSPEQKAIVQEAIVQLVFASLFAGCGGSSLGYHMAGFREILAIEWDKHARAVFAANFPNVPVINADITKLTGPQLLSLLKLNKGDLDVFDASPPCQGFSQSNTKRDATDERNSLYFKTISLIEQTQPKLFVCENVEGMRKGKMIKVYNKIVKRFGKLGYFCKYKIVKAEEYGVPQARRRLIIIGLRHDIQKKFGITQLFPKADIKNVKNMTVENFIPGVIGFSPGQFDDKFISADSPMCTITKTASAWLYDENGLRRKPTIDELKVLSSFPRDFKLFGSFNSQWARVGNAVPPAITKAIGLHIRNHILTPEVIRWCNSKVSRLPIAEPESTLSIAA